MVRVTDYLLRVYVVPGVISETIIILTSKTLYLISFICTQLVSVFPGAHGEVGSEMDREGGTLDGSHC